MIAESSRYIDGQNEENSKSLISMLVTYFDIDLKIYTVKGSNC